MPLNKDIHTTYVHNIQILKYINIILSCHKQILLLYYGIHVSGSYFVVFVLLCLLYFCCCCLVFGLVFFLLLSCVINTVLFWQSKLFFATFNIVCWNCISWNVCFRKLLIICSSTAMHCGKIKICFVYYLFTCTTSLYFLQQYYIVQYYSVLYCIIMYAPYYMIMYNKIFMYIVFVLFENNLWNLICIA